MVSVKEYKEYILKPGLHLSRMDCKHIVWDDVFLMLSKYSLVYDIAVIITISHFHK